MLAAYLITVIVGGVLVVLSIATGSDGHAVEHGGGPDAGHGDPASDQSAAVDVLLSWLPIGSLRFWTFFAAFFGLTGTAMTVLGAAGPVPTAIAAVAVGYASGLLLTRTIRRLRESPSDSSLAEADLVGATAQVLLAIAPGRAGKVRLHIKDRSIDRLAETEEPAIAIGERVLVIAAPREGHVVVARVGKLD